MAFGIQQDSTLFYNLGTLLSLEGEMSPTGISLIYTSLLDANT